MTMKTLFTTVMLTLLAASAYPQEPAVQFSVVNNKQQVSVGDLQLPLRLTFAKEFDGKSVEILSADGSRTVALSGAKLGRGQTVGPNPDDSFSIDIAEDHKVNPGDEVVEKGGFQLRLDGSVYPMKLDPTPRVPDVVGAGGGSTPYPAAVPEEYVPGYVYYDAMRLKSGISDKEQARILAAYGITADNIGSNPYLDDAFKSAFVGSDAQVGFTSLLGAIGSKDVTPFAAGLGRFLAQRFKEELNEAFFRKMKDKLNAYPELNTVFPKSSAVLGKFETYSYASVLQILRDAFETDMRTLPENLYDVKSLNAKNCRERSLGKKDSTACGKRLSALETFFTEKLEGKWVGLGLLAVKEAFASSDPASTINGIATSPDIDSLAVFCKKNKYLDHYNVAASIKLANLISQSLVSKEEGEVWVGRNELRALFGDQNKARVFVGLILAKEMYSKNKIQFCTATSECQPFDSTLIKADRDAGTFSNILAMIKQAHEVLDASNVVAKRVMAASGNGVEPSVDGLYGYYRTLTSALSTIVHSDLLKTHTDIVTAYKKATLLLEPAMDLVYHVSIEDYGVAIYDAVQLLHNTKVSALNDPAAKTFLKYGTLVGTMAAAKTSDEMKKALEASALPLGSSSIKRNSAGSISLNAYVGAYYGWGKVTRLDTVRNTSTLELDTVPRSEQVVSYGLYAPIGFSFCRGFGKGWGGSLTLQVLDLGALVNFYLLEGDEALLPEDFEVRLSSIFAPGVQLGLNFPRTPISLLGGVQYVPALRDVDQITSSVPITEFNATRWHISLVVDLPMLNLHVRDFKE